MQRFDKPIDYCHICGSRRIFQYHKDHNARTIFKCKNCKIQFLNPQYSDEYLSDFYSKYSLEKVGIKRKKVGSYYDTGHHLWYYTPKTLNFLLNKFGFKTVYLRGGYKVRPDQSKFERWLKRNILERFPWESTFLVLAVKTNKIIKMMHI